MRGGKVAERNYGTTYVYILEPKVWVEEFDHRMGDGDHKWDKEVQ
jgi:hypothetical protein